MIIVHVFEISLSVYIRKDIPCTQNISSKTIFLLKIEMMEEVAMAI